MKTFLLSLLVLLTPVFANDAESWPPKGYAHVTGFCYDYSSDNRGERLVFPDGTLHRGIIKAMTVRLRAGEIEELKAIIARPSKQPEEEVECYDPHHGFVFFDEDWKPVGWIEVCFECSDFVASSKQAPDLIDLAKLEAFAKKVGLPVLEGIFAEGESPYHRLFKQENPPVSADSGIPRKADNAATDIDDPFSGD